MPPQADFIVSNGTGNAVRSDINGQLAAIVSNSSGATEPATMYAYQWWADTTTGLLKQRNSANSAWITIGTLASTNLGLATLASPTFTGVVTVPLGTAALPSLALLSDPNTGVFSPGADQVAISTGGTSRLSIDASGNLAVDTNTLYVDAVNNRVAIGTTSPQSPLTVGATTDFGAIVKISRTDANFNSGMLVLGNGNSTTNLVGVWRGDANSVSTGGQYLNLGGYDGIVFAAGNAALGAQNRAMTIDTSGRLLVGTSSSLSSYGINGLLNVASNGLLTRDASFSYFKNDIYGPILTLAKSRSDSIGTFTYPTSGDLLGSIGFSGAHTANGRFDLGCRIDAYANQTWASTALGSYLTFSTTLDGASSPTERMRITNDGAVLAGKTGSNSSVAGTELLSDGNVRFVRSAGNVVYVNRLSDDGDLIAFAQANATEGTISVSGTTVSYNGAHLSRWSQLAGGATREEILRGTVLSNIDEMCGWGDEENEQLNRMKVSDVEGDKNVSGVFQCWDDDDDTYTDDFYCAMTGDFIIRIAEGVTVERGDLLMSAGDGTAKPQGDGYIQDKTIAKVTSTYVTCTYEDGSYCVPCVLMAC